MKKSFLKCALYFLLCLMISGEAFAQTQDSLALPRLESTTGGDIRITSGATLTLSGSVVLATDGDWTNNGILSAEDVSTVIFNCPSTRAFSGASAFGNVVKRGEATLTLNNDMTIAASLDLQDGLIITGINKVAFLSSATVLGGSDSSYVEGFVEHNYESKATVKSFPFGSGGKYRALHLQCASPTTNSLLGKLVDSNANSLSSLPVGLEKVSSYRYYRFVSGENNLDAFSIEAFRVNADDEVGNFASNTSLRLATLKEGEATWTTQSLSVAPNTTAFPVLIETNSFSIPLSPNSQFFVALATTSQSDNPLPVSLGRFTGEASGNKAQLKWNTISEQDNLGFMVMRSEDSLRYYEIGSFRESPSLQGGGTSRVERHYEFTDANLGNNRAYFYKLRSVDLSGIIHDYAPIVSVSVSEAKSLRYKLSQNYPNPFNPTTIINYELESEGKVLLELFDVLGRKAASLVNAKQSAGAHQFVLSAASFGLSSGAYFYRLQSGNFIQTKRMILIK